MLLRTLGQRVWDPPPSRALVLQEEVLRLCLWVAGTLPGAAEQAAGDQAAVLPEPPVLREQPRAPVQWLHRDAEAGGRVRGGRQREAVLRAQQPSGGAGGLQEEVSVGRGWL